MAASIASKMQGAKTGPSIWDRLVKPSSRLETVLDKRNASLLASVLVVLIPLLAAGLAAADITGSMNMAPEVATRLSMVRWGMYVIVLFAYGLSRSRHYVIGASLITFVFWAVVYASTVQNPNTPFGYGAQIMMQIIPILLSSLIFPMRGVALTYGLIQASILALPLLVPERNLAGLVLPSIVLGIGATITLVSMRHRDLIENDRRAELVKANSELGRALVRAEQARREAEEADRLKSEFLATMSHELRTPLHAIIGYADVQLAGIAGEMTKDQNEYQSRILANASHLLAMINDVLDLSKIEAGRMDLAARPFSLRKWADEIARQMSGLASQKQIDFEVKVDPSLPDQTVGDAARVKQIAVNLISNAIKFTEHGKVTVDLSSEGKDAWAIKVADTGVGIPAHAVEFIFEEFRQVDGSSTRQHGGTGLGLAIVRKLTRLMGGTVSVESEVGKGSVFAARLPLVTPAPQTQPAPAMALTGVADVTR